MAQEEFYYDLLNLNEDLEENTHFQDVNDLVARQNLNNQVAEETDFQNVNDLVAINNLNNQMEDETLMRKFNDNVDFYIENENVKNINDVSSNSSSSRSSLSDRDFHQNEYHSLNDYQEDEIELPSENFLNEPLFEKSEHTVEQFISGFLHLADRINVSSSINNQILIFILKFMPKCHRIPQNFETMKGHLKQPKIIGRECCQICSKELQVCRASANFAQCQRKLKTIDYLGKPNPIVWIFDFKAQLKSILEKYYMHILIYREKLNNSQSIIDVLNAGKSKHIDKDSISLILFIDEARIVKGKKIYAFLGMILDLPPIIRKAFFNIITFLYWQGQVKENFNNIVDEHLKIFKEILEDGIFLEKSNKHLKINLHILIGDAQCRAKMAHAKQYNGEFGCSVCLNPGTELRQLLRVYEFGPNYDLRDQVGYLNDLRNVENNGVPSHGIKGPSSLANFVKSPFLERIILDPMHASFLGWAKHFSYLIFRSSSDNDFFIGNFIKE